MLDVATLASWVHGGNHLPYDLLHIGSNHVYSGNLSSYMCVWSSTWNKTPLEFNDFPRLSRFWRPMLVPTVGVEEATLCWTERQRPYMGRFSSPHLQTPFATAHSRKSWLYLIHWAVPMSLCSCTIKFLCAHSPTISSWEVDGAPPRTAAYTEKACTQVGRSVITFFFHWICSTDSITKTWQDDWYPNNSSFWILEK